MASVTKAEIITLKFSVKKYRQNERCYPLFIFTNFFDDFFFSKLNSSFQFCSEKVFRQNDIVPILTRSKKHKICFRFTDEKFSADLLPTVGIDFRVKVFKFSFLNLI